MKDTPTPFASMQKYADALEGKPVNHHDDKLLAARHMDWQQVIMNGGPPCFAIMDDGHFCGRAKHWPGHNVIHTFVSLEDLVSDLSTNEPVWALAIGDASEPALDSNTPRTDALEQTPMFFDRPRPPTGTRACRGAGTDCHQGPELASG
jgi:hypothetical protein